MSNLRSYYEGYKWFLFNNKGLINCTQNLIIFNNNSENNKITIARLISLRWMM